jgi:uncharacterized protein
MAQSYAIIGVSTDTSKYGYKVFEHLRKLGITVYPVNPKYKEIDSIRCFASLAELPVKPDVVVTVVPPESTERIVSEMAALGLKRIWMQPGSESDKAIEFCREKGISMTSNACIMQSTA